MAAVLVGALGAWMAQCLLRAVLRGAHCGRLPAYSCKSDIRMPRIEQGLQPMVSTCPRCWRIY